MNTDKTREMVISRPQKDGDVSDLICEGGTVERFNEYKYFGQFWIRNSPMNATPTTL